MWPPKIPKCPKPLEAFFQELITRVTASWPIDGKGIVCADGTGGRSINLRGLASGGGGSGSEDHAFKVLLKAFQVGGATVWKRGVYYAAPLTKTLKRSDTQTITGKLASITPAEDDPGWIVTEDSGDGFDEVWLEIAFSTWPTISTAAIKSTAANGDMGPEIEHDVAAIDPPNYTQLKARILLADIFFQDDGTPYIHLQWVRSPLRMVIFPTFDAFDSDSEDQQSVIANYPIPWG